MPVDLSLAGDWSTCQNPAACDAEIHIDMDLDQIQHVPHEVLETLLQNITPPTKVYGLEKNSGQSMRFWQDEAGNTHRDFDLPAVIGTNGARIWYQHGDIHRDRDRPAVITDDGIRKWFTHGLCHREDRPAVISPDGSVEYWDQGIRVKQAYEPEQAES